MFAKGYYATVKNLLRSKTFWLYMLLFAILVIWESTKVHFATFNMELQELIEDIDPRYVLSHRTYYKLFGNIPEMLIKYMHPLFMIFSTVLILNRDYGDKYFEIEKACGIRPSVYLLSRVAALITVGFAVITIASAAKVHTYVFLRGGVDGMKPVEYLIDTTVRVLRMSFFKGLPCTVLFVGITYCAGTLFKNGVLASILPIVYTFAIYFHDMKTAANDGIVLEYLCHYPTKITWFFYDYKVDGRAHAETCQMFDTSWGTVMLCIAFLCGVAAVGCAVSYFKLRKRTV